MKPGTAPLHPVRLMDQVRERIRYLHYSLSTEKTDLYWIRFFIRWQAKGGQMRHPRDMGAAEVEAFLTMLATERRVSASTHNTAPACDSWKVCACVSKTWTLTATSSSFAKPRAIRIGWLCCQGHWQPRCGCKSRLQGSNGTRTARPTATSTPP